MSTIESPEGQAYFAKDAFARELGIELVDTAPGRAHVRLPSPSPSQRNGLGTTHGAVLFALADIAFATACNSREQMAVGIQASMSYLSPAADGPISAIATELSRSRKLATYEVRVLDCEEKLIAAFQGMSYLR